MRPARLLPLALALLLLAPSPARAAEPLIPVDLPVLGYELNRGTGTVANAAPIAPAPKTIDGEIADWVGQPSRYAGTGVYSGGEYVYQDYLFDAFGADDGEDVELNATLDPLAELVPESYRSEAVFRYLGGELGAPPPLAAQVNYGNLDPLFSADLEEVHVSIDETSVYVMARTTKLVRDDETALLMLVDLGGPSLDREVPFNSGLRTRRADLAVLMAGKIGLVARLGRRGVARLPEGSVLTNPTGFTNAIEARLPRSMFRLGPTARTLRLAIASGPYDPATGGFADTGLPSNLANVAFRPEEPVREWFEKQQAFSLYERTIDPFTASIDIGMLRQAVTRRYVPGPGYHERIFISTRAASIEGSRDGPWQPFGLFLPKSFREGRKLPLQFWLHWRGGTAHSAGTATPDIFRELGERVNTIVVSPRGRGTSSWYVGAGQMDILEVYDEVTSTFAIDLNRVYLAGHSMGGWGSYLFSILYPDRFAAALPASPPQTQGLWTGLDFPGCDNFTFDEFALCYSPTDDGRARDQAVFKMIGNLRHLPVAVFQGVADELVWYPGVARTSLALTTMGYRNRLYTFPTQEHYGPPVWDQWRDAAAYLHSFVRDPNPAHVTYRRDMPFERAVEQIRTQGAVYNFDFDRAYWMSELIPADKVTGVASFDGRSLATRETPYRAIPEVGGPAAVGQTGPYLMTGLRWLADPTATAPALVNGFQATTHGALAVRLDMARMAIDVRKPVTGTITVERPIELRLAGAWPTLPVVKRNGVNVARTYSDGVLFIKIPAGTWTLTIG
jgi:pimeloyl-ACP methyl ester carboxylesterase